MTGLVAAKFPVEPRPLTPIQDAVVEAAGHQGAAVMAVGGPGTGKTTALVATVLDRVRAGVPLSRMAVLTGSRPAAQQLRARIVAAVGVTQRGLQVTTVHGWCQGLQRRFGDPSAPARLLTAPEQEFRVRELLDGADPTIWPSQVRPALGTRAFAREVRQMLARARQLGLDPLGMRRAGTAATRPEWVGAARFFDEYLDVLDAEGVIDYAELVHRTRLLLTVAAVRSRLAEEAPIVLCDEFAELDPGMINLLADAHDAGCTVVGFADPDTSVFGFRGADPRAVADFGQRFDAPDRKALVLRLDDNLRSVPGIVSAVMSVSARVPSRGAARAPGLSVDAQNPGVRAVVLPDAGQQADWVAAELRRANLSEGIDWSQMAVITRSGRGAVSGLARRLAANGIPVRVAGDEIALSEEVAVRHLLGVLTTALGLSQGEPISPARATRLLRSPIGGLDALGLRRLGRELRRRAVERDDRFAPAPSDVLMASELQTGVLVSDEDADLSVELTGLVRLRGLLTDLSRLLTRGADSATLLWRAWSGTPWPARLRAAALGGGDGAQRAHRDLDAVLALFDVAGRSTELVGDKGMRLLLAEVEGQQIPGDTARETGRQASAVDLLTVHRAKGLEWRLVVLVGLEEGAWPRAGAPASLLQPEQLAADGPQPPPTYAERLADERRAFLLAVSRARERLVATAVTGVSGEGGGPSRFLTELGVPVEQGRPVGGPTTIDGLIAELRRVAADQSASSDVREAAAGELGWLTSQNDDSGRPLAPGADPDHWWGLRDYTRGRVPLAPRDRPVRLTGSEVEQLRACPRMWFLQHRARADQSPRSSATLGTVVHALAQYALTSGVDVRTLIERLDDVWGEISFDAAWLSASERSAALAALERFAAWASSNDHRRILGVEVPFEVPVVVGGHDVMIVGTVDRLEVDADDRLRIVDFKTGRSAPTRAQVAGMDQLGVYQLAGSLGAFDELSGGLRGLADAELVYLRIEDAGGYPKVMLQPSLDDHPVLEDAAGPGPTWVHDHLAEAAATVRSERFPARLQSRCRFCAFQIGCPAQPEGTLA
ncbi:ATP-dependent helicase [Brooklawnia cerclae]|uniref:DNA 3'-5' helicase n=1 Tax=Brooklawnia cerclae TaxID=349934 RepID=A0ABX0SDA1_9ACTN|nr:ATP-dependent DNA helicase [Brooklawnia cerclae]NIH56367.1 superfamily I DNA/RNA helicase/RecB family exonuclease [Brooklawnia cerclae]